LAIILALVLIVGGCIAIQSTGGGSGSSSSQEAAPPGSPQPYTGPPETGPTVKPPTPNNPRWTGRVRVTTDGLDFRPSPKAGGAAIQLNGWGTGFALGGRAAAFWTEASLPTYEQCIEQINAQPMNQDERATVPTSPGTKFCAYARSKDWIYYAEIVSETEEAAQVDVTVWSVLDA